jgi:ABC-type branched-subunit amino acid transport system ATPase component
MIDAENLTSKFGDLTVVDKLTFHIEEGEVFGFLGPNGAGKTTTMMVIGSPEELEDSTLKKKTAIQLKERNEKITSGRLYEVYKEFSKGNSVSYRRIFDFINELEMLGLISTKTVSRERGRGRTNIIDLQCDIKLLEDAMW